MWSERRTQVRRVKPIGVPLPNRVHQVIREILSLFSLAELDATTTKNKGLGGTRLGLEPKKVTEKRDRRRNIEKGLAEVNEDEKVEKCIGGEMIQGNFKEIKESLKKKGSGKAETDPNEGDKEHDFTCVEDRDTVLSWGPPLGKLLGLH